MSDKLPDRGMEQIGWRLRIFDDRARDQRQLWALGTIGELAARSAVKHVVGATIAAFDVGQEALPEAMRAATPRGRRWYLMALGSSGLSHDDMATARQLYGNVFQDTLDPYVADRLGFQPETIEDEWKMLYIAPPEWSSTELWTPRPSDIYTF